MAAVIGQPVRHSLSPALHNAAFAALGLPWAYVAFEVADEHQGRGLGKRAVAALLAEAREDGRWGKVLAAPAVTNGASNGICRRLGFTFVGERDTEVAGRILRTNHWTTETLDRP